MRSRGAGKGYVSAFDFAGNFLARVASGGVLNAPWGIAKADPNFGAFGGDLLIGNFGDGRINAFHENADGTWTPSGTLKGLNGNPLFIGGLWAIQFGSGAANNGQRNHLYFTAGPNGETAGLFGRIIPNPSEAGGTVPATLSLTLGTPAGFGAFTPGVAKDYTASTTATVISSAGDATLQRRRPQRDQHRQARQRHVRARAGRAGDRDERGRHRRDRRPGRRLGGPDDAADLRRTDQQRRGRRSTFKQSIGVNEPLRTGAYSKTLTFTLSTTTPYDATRRSVITRWSSRSGRQPNQHGAGPDTAAAA